MLNILSRKNQDTQIMSSVIVQGGFCVSGTDCKMLLEKERCIQCRVLPEQLGFGKDTVIKVLLRNLHIVPCQLLIIYLHPPFSLKLELPIQILKGKLCPLYLNSIFVQ